MLISQRPTLSEESLSETRSRFTIEPLEPGFGYTLGNSLRRTLLSSIPGAAVTSIKIDGVLHEFTTIPGVKEDVVELVMNIKELCVSSEHDEPVSMYLRKQGPGDVTAGDIQPPAGVSVHNPDLKLATLNGKGRLDMELTVERGRGYVTAAQNKQTGQEIGRIPVDSIYSPVLKVTYRVEATRVEQRTDFDRLIIDVEAKPSITPRTASMQRVCVAPRLVPGQPRACAVDVEPVILRADVVALELGVLGLGNELGPGHARHAVVGDHDIELAVVQERESGGARRSDLDVVQLAVHAPERIEVEVARDPYLVHLHQARVFVHQTGDK